MSGSSGGSVPAGWRQKLPKQEKPAAAIAASTGHIAADPGRTRQQDHRRLPVKFARYFNEKFPGFETDVHGLVKREVNGRRDYFVDFVRQ
ncbi:hypothetical protein PMI16_00612 [Herbaspirillum sp. CF444]|uniref:hypothetical protein n=1 Tax=Herbaspirillum sp. CF444 TaxID=1144319 RepID=UPI0002728386|nr:hypothetical protein [Herbaspirillum sp. CF444]EJL93289.1 hypothetical protein PMI16_00612 [Herbaspirillum sp. CF444]